MEVFIIIILGILITFIGYLCLLIYNYFINRKNEKIVYKEYIEQNKENSYCTICKNNPFIYNDFCKIKTKKITYDGEYINNKIFKSMKNYSGNCKDFEIKNAYYDGNRKIEK